MNNNIPYQMPNFMPYTPMSNQNINDEIRRSLDKIQRELEHIERKLSKIENNLNIKESNYLSSNVTNEKGLYML